jgi:hypothetical protein
MYPIIIETPVWIFQNSWIIKVKLLVTLAAVTLTALAKIFVTSMAS